MKITIDAEAKEIAALVVALQERQISADEVVREINDRIGVDIEDNDWHKNIRVADDTSIWVDRDMDKHMVTIIAHGVQMSVPDSDAKLLGEALRELFVEADSEDDLTYRIPRDFR